MTPYCNDSIKFLKKVHPNSFLLNAIPRDGGTFAWKHVTDQDDSEVISWIERHNTNHNIYYAFNPVKGEPENGKATKDDVLHAIGAHCDIDARAGKDLQAELDRILMMLQNPPKGVPKPTVIVYSGGGYQALWLFKEPASELAIVERINEKLIATLGGDKGTGNIDRILRLPYTLNLPNAQKMKKGREVRMAEVIEFNDLRYMLDDFGSLPDASIEIDVSVNADPKKIARYSELPAEIKGDARVIIAQGKDPDNAERFPSRSEALWYCVCQMVRDGIDDQVILNIITDPGWPISESILEKGRGADRYALKQIGDAKAENVASMIVQREGALNEVIDAAERILIDNDLPIFRRGSELVRIATVGDTPTGDGSIRREAGTDIILPVKKHWLAQQWADNGDWAKLNPKGKPYAADPDLKYADHYLARVGDWKVRHLAGITNTPTLRRDGSLLDTPGYDVATGLLYDPRGVEFPPIPQDADLGLAQVKMLELYKPFAEFPCVSDAAKSVVLSAVLTSLVRYMFDASPMHVLDAPTPGTGKSLIGDAVGIIALGHTPAASAQGKTEEEDEKRLATILREGDPIIVIDNITQPLNGQFLCSAITQATVQARILGKSERVVLPTRTLFIANGNNVSVHADMTRRVLMCRLDAEVERPERRQFDFCPRVYCREHRAQLVAAGLTAIRAYLNAGRPMRSQISALGSFEQWNLIREVLVWLNYADPVDTQNVVIENDETRDEVAEFLGIWRDHWDGQEMTAGQIIALAETSDDILIRECVMDKCGGRDWNARKLGRWLTKNRDRVVNGMILRRRGANCVYRIQKTG